jgi:hypothetical protein
VRGIDFQRSIDNPSAPARPHRAPFQWKGSVPFLRDFNRGAAHNELGMQAVEIVGDNVDGDFDGVQERDDDRRPDGAGRLHGAQPRPTSLSSCRARASSSRCPPSASQTIAPRRVAFVQAKCATCHIPAMLINQPIFSEPSSNAAYRDGDAFPADRTPSRAASTQPIPSASTSPATSRTTASPLPNGTVFPLGSLRRDNQGRGIVELFGDLKRHEMGPQLAEPVNEIAGDDVTPIPVNPLNRHTPSTFLTENLWGVGSTPPYMHDGRATTLARGHPRARDGRDERHQRGGAARRAYLATAAGGQEGARGLPREPGALQDRDRRGAAGGDDRATGRRREAPHPAEQRQAEASPTKGEEE